MKSNGNVGLNVPTDTFTIFTKTGLFAAIHMLTDIKPMVRYYQQSLALDCRVLAFGTCTLPH